MDNNRRCGSHFYKQKTAPPQRQMVFCYNNLVTSENLTLQCHYIQGLTSHSDIRPSATTVTTPGLFPPRTWDDQVIFPPVLPPKALGFHRGWKDGILKNRDSDKLTPEEPRWNRKSCVSTPQLRASCIPTREAETPATPTPYQNSWASCRDTS